MRKPTVAAWTAGLLARSRPEEAHSFIQLGEALRAAHRTLDAGQLRKLSHDQHVVIGDLARTARALAGPIADYGAHLTVVRDEAVPLPEPFIALLSAHRARPASRGGGWLGQSGRRGRAPSRLRRGCG
ncbi:hypothetical protein ACFVFI_37335, partial [Streptomyces sp. NPDC057705]